MKPACAVSGCARPHDAKGYCSLHYKRWKRHGDPSVGRRVASVARYTWAYRPGHPIACADGKVLTHRLTLFNRIGTGIHPCFWCGSDVDWLDGSLFTDHVDHDTYNNAEENLVPSCNPCNAHRVQGEEWNPWESGTPAGRPLLHTWCRKRLHRMTLDNVYVRKDGSSRCCRACNLAAQKARRATRRDAAGVGA